MCDCAGNSKPQNLNVSINKNVDELKNTSVKNNKEKNTSVKNNYKEKNNTVPSEKASKTSTFLSILFAKFL